MVIILMVTMGVLKGNVWVVFLNFVAPKFCQLYSLTICVL